MSDEEMNRKMEFIVEHLARVSVLIDKLAERDERLAERDDKLAERQERLAERQERFYEELVVLRDTANTALELSSHTGETVTKLIESQMKTDRQLRSLARVVKAHVRDGHDHGAA